MTDDKINTSIRLDATDRELLRLLAAKLGGTQTMLIKQAIRKLASANRVKLPKQEEARP